MKSLVNYEEIIIFDLETTGLDKRANHIIELGYCKFRLHDEQYVLEDEYDKLIRINYNLPKKIIHLTGITDEMLQFNGRDETEIANEFYNMMIQDVHKKKLLVAYNAHFDIGFLKEMFERYNLSIPSNIDFLDVLTVFKDRASYPHKLKDAIIHFDLQSICMNSHRAIDDCKATFEVLKSLRMSFDDLNKYINLFGYNPKYYNFERIPEIIYRAQPYNSNKRLYEK